MEDTLRAHIAVTFIFRFLVLILVLMEDTLRDIIKKPSSVEVLLS